MNNTINKDKQDGRQRYWQAHIKALAKSGYSRAEYCRQNNLSFHAMAYWQKKISRTDKLKPLLVPVPLQNQLKQNNNSSNPASLHIVIPGNLSIAVGDNFSPVTLTRLLTVLESR